MPLNEIVFVDGTLDDLFSLAQLSGAHRTFKVIDPVRDGLQQILSHLEGLKGLGAIHIVGHGKDGEQYIGTTVLDAQCIETEAESCAAIGACLHEDGAILLYGCNVASGKAGRSMVKLLAKATGAEVAASTNVTSGSLLGGDAVLEFSTGYVGAQSLRLPDTFGPLGAWETHVLSPNPPGDPMGTGARAGQEITGPLTVDGFTFSWNGYAEEDSNTLAFGTHWSGRPGEASFVRAAYGPDVTEITVEREDASAFRAAGLDLNYIVSELGTREPSLTFMGFRDGQAVTSAVTVSDIMHGRNVISIIDPAFSNIDKLVITSAEPIRAQGFSISHGPAVSEGSLGVTLDPGDIAVIGYDQVGYNAAFVALADIPGDHYIFLTTTGWNSHTQDWVWEGMGLAAKFNEPVIAWKTPSEGVAAGTVFELKDMPGGSSMGGIEFINDNSDPGFPIRDQINIFELSSSDAMGTPSFVYGANFSGPTAGSNGFHTDFPAESGFEGGLPYGLTPAASGEVGSAFGLIPTGVKGALRPGVLVDGMTREEALQAIHTPSNWVAASYVEDTDSYDFSSMFSDIVLATGQTNQAPTLTTIGVVPDGVEDTVQEITLSQLKALADEADSDGTVDAFVIRHHSTGDLMIGTDAATATPYVSGTNDVIDATHNAYWTPNFGVNGVQTAFTVVARDNGGMTSTNPVGVQVSIQSVPDPVTVTITSSTPTLTAGQTASITFTFSEDPGSTFTWDGFRGDVVVSGGTLSAISGEGVIRTATFTPTPDLENGSASITVAAGSYTDMAGNLGGSGATPSLTFDTAAPAVTSIVRDGAAVTNATSVDYIVTFDQSVTGVGTGDFALQRVGTAAGTVSSVSGSGDTYTVTVNGISGDGTLRLDLKNAGTGITDTAGNAAAGYTGGQTYTFDHTAPVVSSVAVPAAATYRAGQDLEFTVNFNEAVTVNTNSGTPSIALTLDTGGTVQAGYVSGSGSSALTFRYTVVTGNADANGVALASGITLNGGTIKDAVGNDSALALNSIGATSGVLVAALPPTVVGIERIGGELTNGPSAEYSVTFSDSVIGVDASDFTLVLNGVTGNITSVTGSGDTWTVTIANISGNGMLRLDLNGGGTGIVDSSNQSIAGGYTSGQIYTIDTMTPNLAQAITITDTALKIGDSATVTFAFSEVVGSFTVEDVTVPNGTLSDLASSDGGRTWTATLTPAVGTSDSTNVLTLDYSGIADLAGNTGTGSADSGNYAVDTVRPSLASAITISDTALNIGGSATVTFTFTEAVTGFTIADVTVPNGTLSDLTPSDGGRTWTATLAPAADTSDATNMLTLDYSGIADLAGNVGTGTASSGNYTIDTVRPGLASSITISDTDLRAGESATITFTFTEAVMDFTSDDVTVPNGALSELISIDGGITWTATLTPSAGTSASANVLTLDYSGVVDLAGNVGTGVAFSGNYAVNTTVPALASPIVISDTELKIGDSATVTFIFTEVVTGFTVDNVTVPNGKLLDLESTDGGVTWTAALTPAADATSASNVLTLNYTGIVNQAGNAGSGTADSPVYAVDTIRPSLASGIIISDTNLKAGDTATVTFTFFEAVTDFDIEDVTVPNGTLSGLASDGYGRVWTATLTPDEEARDASNVLTLNYSGITDLAGNTGTGTSASLNYAVDTILPKLAQPITISDTALKIGDTAEVTFVFTEAVTGFTVQNVTVSNGKLSELASGDGITWTATLTPAESASALTNVLSLDYSGIATLSGNVGSGTAESECYTVDTVAPTIAVALDVTSLKAGATALVTFTFSEEPQGFTLEDMTAQGGQLSDFSMPVENGDGTWSATAIFTPAPDQQSENNVITVNTSWTDTAGNTPEAPAVSVNYVVDTVPPAAPTITSAELSKSATPVIAGTAEPGVSVIVTVGGATYTVEADADGWTLDLGEAVPDSGDLLLHVNGVNPVVAIARDTAGNESEAGTQTLVIDSTAPNVTVTLDTASLKAGEQALVTFTFTEQPQDFSLSAVTADGGDLGNLSGPVEIDGTWSATAIFTPSEGLEQAANVITVRTDWTDMAGNAPAEPVESGNYIVDTLPPLAPGFTSDTLSNDTRPVISGTAQAGASVIVTVGGATYTVQANDEGWTLDLGEAVPTSGALSLNLNGENPVSAIARDALGNESETGTQTLVIDTARPSVLITMSDTNLTVRETATVTFTFDEAPHGFSLEDVTAEGGQLSNLSDLVKNGDGTWSSTATFTPTPNLSDRTNVIAVSTEWTDAAGNAPLGAAVSGNYVINTYPPEPITPPVTPPVIPPMDQWEGLPDNDGDGIPESVENQVPGMAGGVVGDGNGDGIADILQTDVSSLPWAQTPDGTTRFVTLTNGSGLAQTGVKPLEVVPGQVPADLKLPLGLLAFEVANVPDSGSVDFTVYLDSDIAVNGYWKQVEGQWVNIARSITTEGGKTKISFTIEDGGRFDADGVKNGRIVDPGAPGWRAVTNPNEDTDGDQFPDALESANGLTAGVKDNDVFASTKLFVMQLYRDFLYREAEPEGLAYWQARLDSGELARADVAHAFLFASEFQDNAGAVARLYMGTYDRIPDNGGMHYWVDAVREGQSLVQVAEQFAASDEFAELYGSLDNAGFVNGLYLNVQGREADAGGSAWWLSQLDAGMSRGEVLVRFTQSDEFVEQSRDAVSVTLDYVGLLDRTPEQAGFDYWLDQIEEGRSKVEVIGQFLGTEEYHDRFLPGDSM